jgi:hypothetical protein
VNTRRYPRTCDEAFGPYNRSSQCVIEPIPSAATARCDIALYVVFVIALVVVGWLA